MGFPVLNIIVLVGEANKHIYDDEIEGDSFQDESFGTGDENEVDSEAEVQQRMELGIEIIDINKDRVLHYTCWRARTRIGARDHKGIEKYYAKREYRDMCHPLLKDFASIYPSKPNNLNFVNAFFYMPTDSNAFWVENIRCLVPCLFYIATNAN
ncbi:hypothetical protein Cgig2_009744 [Carnegiea gigantea]|uniref:Uncharacterized protein n=1 Tax=Carnegiea gigantea TaxID=171969 RepID=A0A9Q1JVY7_9CARY|nr:hypothetical protein Cgig2_009744 [Carnegiea gigantea]